MADSAMDERSLGIRHKTFTRWTNTHLRERMLEIDNLETDLADGTMLLALLEIIASKTVAARYTKKPKIKTQMLENVQCSLDFLRKEGVMANIGAEDIVDMKLKLILGLIWTIILRYQIHIEQGKSARSDLLNWVRSKIPEYNIGGFTHDWNDGRAICGLTNALKPGLIPDHFDRDPANSLANATHGEDVAEKELGIPKVLAPEDMISENVDELSVMTYISYFRDWEANEAKRRGEGAAIERPPVAGKCKAYGPGLEKAELTAAVESPSGGGVPEGGAPLNVEIQAINFERTMAKAGMVLAAASSMTIYDRCDLPDGSSPPTTASAAATADVAPAPAPSIESVSDQPCAPPQAAAAPAQQADTMPPPPTPQTTKAAATQVARSDSTNNQQVPPPPPLPSSTKTSPKLPLVFRMSDLLPKASRGSGRKIEHHSFGHLWPLGVRYTQLTELSSGGAYGSCYLGKLRSALDPTGSRREFVKVLKFAFAGKDFFRKSMRELIALAAVRDAQHPNLAPLLGFIVRLAGDPDLPRGLFALVFEKLGGDLENLVASQSPAAHQALDSNRLSLLKQACHAVAYVHSLGIAHRDVKCGNLLVDQHGVLKLTDMGEVKCVSQAELTSCLQQGTPVYKDIAQLTASGASARKYDAMAGDVWSLGVSALVMLFHAHPFCRSLPRGTASFESLVDLIVKCTKGGAVRIELVQKVCGVAPASNLSDGERQLIEAMLQLDPARRPSAFEVLQHPVFRDVKPPVDLPAPRPPRPVYDDEDDRMVAQFPSLEDLRTSDIHDDMRKLYDIARHWNVLAFPDA